MSFRRSEAMRNLRAGGRSDILLKPRRIFGHGEEAPIHDEETPQPCFAKNRAGRKRFKRSTP